MMGGTDIQRQRHTLSHSHLWLPTKPIEDSIIIHSLPATLWQIQPASNQRVALARNRQQKRNQIQMSTIKKTTMFPCAKSLTHFRYRSKYLGLYTAVWSKFLSLSSISQVKTANELLKFSLHSSAGEHVPCWCFGNNNRCTENPRALWWYHMQTPLSTNSTAVDELKLANFIHAIVDSNKRQCSRQPALTMGFP
jgi:hypothetical protein